MRTRVLWGPVDKNNKRDPSGHLLIYTRFTNTRANRVGALLMIKVRTPERYASSPMHGCGCDVIKGAGFILSELECC